MRQDRKACPCLCRKPTLVGRSGTPDEVGATGSIGSLVVAESLAAGHRTRALVRDQAKAHGLSPSETEIAVGDVTRPETLTAAVDGVDAIVLTPGSDGAGRAAAYNQSPQAHDWKRRSERLVRASGHPYTIVRPGWFDCNTADQQQLTLELRDVNGPNEAEC